MSCPKFLHFWICDDLIGCCKSDSCNGLWKDTNEKPRFVTFEATFYHNGTYRASNNGTCEYFSSSSNSCCDSDSYTCPVNCPHELPKDLLSDIFHPTTSPSIARTSSKLSSSTSSPQYLEMSSSVSSSVPTTTAASQSTPLNDTPASSSVSSSIAATTVEDQPTRPTDTHSSASTNTPTSKSNSTAIAGGVAGGIVGLALLVGLLAICCRRRTARPQQTVEGRSSVLGSGQPRSLQTDSAELEEMKQGPTPSRCSFLYEHGYG